MAHDLLAATREEQLETHDFALGYGASAKNTDTTIDAEASEAGADTKQAHNTPGEEGTAPVAAVEADATERAADQHEKETATAASAVATASPIRDPSAASDPPISSSPEKERGAQGVEQHTTQAAGEPAIEKASKGDGSSHEGTTKTGDTGVEEQQQLSSSQAEEHGLPASNLPGAPDQDGLAVAVEVVGIKERQSNISKTLPDSLAQEIGDRAFPLAHTTERSDNEKEEEEEGRRKGEEKEGNIKTEEKEEQEQGSSSRGGVFCAAFHALAAEAVWAGLNGSDRVEKPPESVWDPRGGDRWGTAAFFAEQIGEREEEVAPGLPQQAKMLMSQARSTSGDGSGGVGVGGSIGGGGGGCSGGHPLSGGSVRHAKARAVCMAAVSSRRGFLQQATEEAANEVCPDTSLTSRVEIVRRVVFQSGRANSKSQHIMHKSRCSQGYPNKRTTSKFTSGNISACFMTNPRGSSSTPSRW